ncbi:MAG: hypothetical protein IPK60_04505 [Sandaracinaceae bacterium]|nr:hypothetical protein [Sandaracinaceae bacterium]
MLNKTFANIAAVTVMLVGTSCAQSFEVLSTSDAGADGGPPVVSISDAGADAATPVPPGCAAQAFHVCSNACTDDMFPTYLWDGSRCVAVCPITCVGADCGSGSSSPQECMNAHAQCAPALCGLTGGTWNPAQGCPYECGARINDVGGSVPCAGVAGCQCAPGETFDAASGCVAALSCTRTQLCEASGGEWRQPRDTARHFYECGEDLAAELEPAPSIEEFCFCGHGGTASSTTHTCVYGADCRARASDESDREYADNLCTSSGGTWHTTDSEHSFCGLRGGVSGTGACECGPLENFDASAGCVIDGACYSRSIGNNCSAAISAYCEGPDAYCDTSDPFSGAYTCSLTSRSFCEMPAHRPECQNIGTRSEGWYWVDTGDLICWTSCASSTPVCETRTGAGGTGWFTDDTSGCGNDPPSAFIVADTCA